MTTKYNLKKHMMVVYTLRERNYIKHIKKDNKVICKVCGKKYYHPKNLKFHLANAHTKEQLVDSKLPIEPILHYSKRAC